ncbi:DUF1616 domain-containing protein [Chloroflexota bacterium]
MRFVKFGKKNELIPLNVLVIALIFVARFLPYDSLRVALGLPFLLFFPGYTLIAVLFPKKEGLSAIERIALSFGVSIAVVPLIVLILNYSPWGIGVQPILYSVASFIFATSIIAWLRRRRLPEPERYSIEIPLKLPGWGGGIWDKALSIILIVVVLGALGFLSYVVATPKEGVPFSEFSILGLNGRADDYPSELGVGEEAKVIGVIVNHENEMMVYRIEVKIGGVKNSESEPVTVAIGGKWEGTISFIPQKAGSNEKVEFILYKNGEAEPYLDPLYLWIDVIE